MSNTHGVFKLTILANSRIITDKQPEEQGAPGAPVHACAAHAPTSGQSLTQAAFQVLPFSVRSGIM